MKDTPNIAIAVLAVFATILATVVTLSFVASPARADSAVGAGDYVMICAQYNSGTDVLYVFDLQKRAVNLYVFDRQERRLVLKQSLDLSKQLFRNERGKR